MNPDVEAIMAEIQRAAATDPNAIPEPAVEAGGDQGPGTDLQAANEQVAGSSRNTPGWLRACRRLAYRCLGLHGFHGSVVRILNALVREQSGAMEQRLRALEEEVRRLKSGTRT